MPTVGQSGRRCTRTVTGNPTDSCSRSRRPRCLSPRWCVSVPATVSRSDSRIASADLWRLRSAHAHFALALDPHLLDELAASGSPSVAKSRDASSIPSCHWVNECKIADLSGHPVSPCRARLCWLTASHRSRCRFRSRCCNSGVRSERRRLGERTSRRRRIDARRGRQEKRPAWRRSRFLNGSSPHAG